MVPFVGVVGELLMELIFAEALFVEFAETKGPNRGLPFDCNIP